MTDTNISYDLASMNKQERGRHSNPHYGLIPNGKSGLRMLYLGGFFFLAGYLGTGVAAITTFTLRHSTRWVALYLAAEFAVVYLILVKTGRLYFILASGHAASVFIWFIFYLMMTFVPFTQLRAPAQFGGALFARWVTWRLVANTVAFALLAKDTAMWRYYRALLGSAVVGIGLVVCNVSDTHRWTLYQTRESAKESSMRYFNQRSSHLHLRRLKTVSESILSWPSTPPTSSPKQRSTCCPRRSSTTRSSPRTPSSESAPATKPARLKNLSSRRCRRRSSSTTRRRVCSQGDDAPREPESRS